MDRRLFLKQSFAMAAAASLPQQQASSAPVFSTANREWQAAYDKALNILAGNVRVLPRFPQPVLIEGAQYIGIWQECGPHESLVYHPFRPDVARNSHQTFFSLQRPDGQMTSSNKISEAGLGQIQMVVPIAATAWEVVKLSGDQKLLESAYTACSRWDEWLGKYRNTRGTGLVEGFCTFDTGHDNSPRWEGIPPRCPGNDAKRYPPIPTLPRLCPDLSATIYGGRRALAEMAQALGKKNEADRWTEQAEKLRSLIIEKLYVPEDGAFYDLDAKNNYVRVVSDAISRVCGEHVVDQKMFDSVWERQLGNPKAFWSPYPFPSIAMDDPTFRSPIPSNSWGGPSQALTALRASRWMDHYGRHKEFAFLMDRWCQAILRDMTFRQQMDPRTGEFAQGDEPGYSPACLMFVDSTWRLVGVREVGDELWWNFYPGHAAAQSAYFRLQTSKGKIAEMRYGGDGVTLSFNGHTIANVKNGTGRLVTSASGQTLKLVGVSEKPEMVKIDLAPRDRHIVTLQPNQHVSSMFTGKK